MSSYPSGRTPLDQPPFEERDEWLPGPGVGEAAGGAVGVEAGYLLLDEQPGIVVRPRAISQVAAGVSWTSRRTAVASVVVTSASRHSQW